MKMKMKSAQWEGYHHYVHSKFDFGHSNNVPSTMK